MPSDGLQVGPTRSQRIVNFLGLKRSIVGMLGMVVLVGMGKHMAEKYLPRYLEVLSEGTTLQTITMGWKTVFAIGILAWMDDFLSALYSFPGGYLNDRLGTKRALMVFNFISMIGYLIVILVKTWWAILLGAAFFISWSAISLPATMSLISKAVPKSKRTMGVSLQALVRRVPKTLGPLLGGLFIAIWGTVNGVRLAFVAALALAIVAMIVQQVLIEDDRNAPRKATERGAERNPLRLYREMSPPLRNLLASDVLIRFCERIPDAFVILWCMMRILHPIDEFRFGLLTVIENVTSILIYIPVAHFADRFGKKPFVAITFGFFALFPLALLNAQSMWVLIPVFVLRGLKEFGEPTRKALIMDLAPEDRKAAMFGLYYLIRDVIVSLAALGGAFLWMIGPRVNLLVAFGFGIIGTVWFILRGKDVSPQKT